MSRANRTNRTPKSIRLACLAFLVQFMLHAQPEALPDKSLIFDQLPLKLGLNQRSVNDILQDSEGYLWVGTWSGLVRYDGYETKIFTASAEDPHALKSTKVTAMVEDSLGNLWVGTRVAGLFYFDKHTEHFTQYTHQRGDGSSLSNNNVWSLQIDHQGHLWVGTENGLNVLRKGSSAFVTYGRKDGLIHDFINGLYLDHTNRLWLSTEYGANRLVIEHGDIIETLPLLYKKDPQAHDLHNYLYKITSLVVEGKEQVFISSKKGLKWYDGQELRNFMYPREKSGYSFFRSLLPVKGTKPFLLVGSELGLQVFDITSQQFQEVSTTSMSHPTIMDIYLDATEVLWVGTKKGLNRLDTYDKDFVKYQTSAFDASGSIITGLVGEGRYLWVSTLGGGVFRFDKKSRRFRAYELQMEEREGFSDFVQKLFLDSKGHLWLGTAGTGVIQFDPNHPDNRGFQVSNYKHYHAGNGLLSDDYIMSLKEGGDGSMWVGTWNHGLNRIMADGQVKEYQDEIFTRSPIVSMHAENQTLWLGTRGSGLLHLRVSDEELEIENHYTVGMDETQVSNVFITKIAPAGNGDLWVGTEEGLNYLDTSEDRFIVFKQKDGLVTNEVNSLLTDNEGQLWLANFKGLTVFNVTPGNVSLINHFDTEDRIQGGFFYNDVAHKDADGLLYFGGPDGFNVIDPKQLSLNPHPPQVAINDISIFDQPLRQLENDPDRQWWRATGERRELVLNHYESSVKFTFSAMHFAAPGKNKYAFMLEGFDQDWRLTASDQRFANYTNLPDGNYTFRVRASNNDGLWSEQSEEVKLVILPPWWRTRWAFIGYVLIIGVVLMLFRKMIIIRANYANNLKLERLEKENLEALNKAKLQFFTNVSHEFRTPLTLILDPIEQLVKSGEGGKLFKEQLAIVSLNTQRLLRLVNQLLDFRKIESSKVQLRAAEGNLVKFVKEIKLSFDALAERRNIDFQLHATSNVIKVYFDRDQFEKVIFNLLSNAFKYVPTGGRVTIKLVENQDNVHIKVEDNGSGVALDQSQRVFERFYSGGDTQVGGTGIGLALTKSLVELHGGTIAVQSTPHELTTFELTIPKGREHLAEDQLIADFKDSDHIALYEPLDEHLAHAETTTVTVDVSEMDKVLIVEDNADVRAYLKSIFHGKYIVLEAENGKEGLDVALEEIPMLVISDVMMPVMDGISFCKELKSNVSTSHIPVILLTARTSFIFQVEGLEHGADDYITKPFNSQLLLIKVRNLIKSRRQLQKLFRDNDELVIEPKKVTLTSSDEVFIEQALESIENNMSNSDYTVEDLGRDVGLSRMQLYRKLKAMTGQSANEFIRTIRLKRAAQLIGQNELTIAEITYQVGFSDLPYFRKCFKKQFGVNPSAYGKPEAAESES
ncbi:two-component regulator propeller domain-containing protein [Marinoscillum furvescens]|uniref:histidine kinase n=1 Tax=Marinoscillum furvescens DSM 4134 TaxID=1122208 RepID=A0A3D9L286_MARFU|nr:two-component regulator propeller domain-containing protein [Marinoscillum furvescens]RED95284.1 two component regulator with propeller domain [Marinoscillum furvescens DSM 4134]